MWIARYYRSSIGKKSVMAVTGLGLALFLLLHTAGNASALFGRAAYLAYARHLHGLGPLLSLAEAGLVLCFLGHVVTGVILFVGNRAARPQRYAVAMRRRVSPPARLMPYTGLVILLFIVVHLVQFHAGSARPPVADLVRDRLSRPDWAVFYALGVGAAVLHLWHGGWSLWQSLGISHPKYDSLLRRGAVVGAVVVGIVLLLIPLLAVTSSGFLR